MIGINVRELIGWVGTLVIAMGTIYFAFWYVGVWVRYKRYLRRRVGVSAKIVRYVLKKVGVTRKIVHIPVYHYTVGWKNYESKGYSWALGICDGRWGTIYKEETVNAEE